MTKMTYLRGNRVSRARAAAVAAAAVLLIVVVGVVAVEAAAQATTTTVVEEPSCAWDDSWCEEETERDPALKEFTYDVGDGPRTTFVYVEPDLNSFYSGGGDDDDADGNGETYSRVQPAFSGLAGKFVSMSSKNLEFYWEDAQTGTRHLMDYFGPFGTGGSGTFPTHRFFLADPEGDPGSRLNLWVVGDYPENVYFYDPYLVEGDPEQTERNLREHLDDEERSQYDKWRKTVLFNEQYKAFTGRSYLAHYGENGPRPPPMHHMWRADHFGQQHRVTTQETHFVGLPPEEKLRAIHEAVGSGRILGDDSDPRHLLREYRAVDDATGEPLESMNMTLTVLSVAPRVFEIRDFLSLTEVEHILRLAGAIDLSRSRTGNTETEQSDTRTSRNSWVGRDRSPIIDAIYRRAADITKIDESLLRLRSEDEHPEMDNKASLAEDLQLVHYDVTQQYTAHHDFGYSHVDDEAQGQRFATLLLYLNEDMVGGETAFPRFVNGETFHELKVKPKTGKAVLFYSQLPDGNFDDFSQHSAKPIVSGEKWLINLWISDPERSRR